LHSLSTAVIAENIFKQACGGNSETAFITALMHDLGKIPLDNNFKKVLPRSLDLATNNALPFFWAERKLIGFNHADLGRYLMQQWNFPENVGLSIFNHHKPGEIMNVRHTEHRLIQSCTFTANIISKAMSLGHSCDECLPEIPSKMLQELSLEDGPSDSLLATIFRELGTLLNYLKVTNTILKIGKLWPTGKLAHAAVVTRQRHFFHPLILALRKAGIAVKVLKSPSTHDLSGFDIALAMLDEEPEIRGILFPTDAQSHTGSMPKLNLLLYRGGAPESTQALKEKFPVEFFPLLNLDFRVVKQTITHYLEED
jgi:putative nucleotidyltransferase with HDIG domain